MTQVPGAPVPEFTLRAAVAGVAFGIVFGAANAYLGLRVGLTVATSIPIAVLTVALFRLLGRGRGGSVLLEANLSQTIGSASSSLASGTIFTIPALFLWGFAPPLWQVAALAFLGGILGISAMIPLRRLLIVKSADELPYPEGTACAEVLKATAAESRGGRFIFLGLAAGAVIKLLLGAVALIPSELSVALPLLPKAELALEVAPALLAVGYILGFKQGSIMVAGSLLSSLVFIPLIASGAPAIAAAWFPPALAEAHSLSAGAIWKQYVRYVGAGAVAAAGMLAVARALPTMYQSLVAVLRGLRRSAGEAVEEPPRTDRDLPGWVVLAGPALVILALVGVPGLLAGEMSFGPRLAAGIGVAVFGVAFVVVSSRIVGLIGVSSNPTSGMTLVTLLGVSLIFVLCGWTDASARAAILTVGTVVCIAASKAGDISQDLKTGYLVGATPARQQAGQFLGAAFACWAVAATVLVLGQAFTFGSRELAAPQATLMKTVIEGVLAGSLPWGLVGFGAPFGLPGLGFAVGIYLPLASLTPVFVGGLVRRIVDPAGGKVEGDAGVLAASGTIAGEGLAGVAIALVVAARTRWHDAGWSGLLGQWHFAEKDFAHVTGAPAAVLGIALVAAVCGLLYAAGRSEAHRT